MIRSKSHTKNKRLYPPSYGSLYYSLTKLRETLEKQLALIRSKISVNDLLLIDISCGTKPYQEIVEKFNISYSGADIEENKEAEFKISENGKFFIDDNLADIVLSTQALEHVYDFDTYLRECYRITKPGGYLLLSTIAHWRYHPDPNDYWRWTSCGLKRTVERNDWTIESFEGIMSLSAIALQYLQENTSYKLKFKCLIAPYIWLFQKLIILVDSFSSEEEKSKEASTFFLVARKAK